LIVFSVYGVKYTVKVLKIPIEMAGTAFGGITVATGVAGTALGGAILDSVRSRHPNDLKKSLNLALKTMVIGGSIVCDFFRSPFDLVLGNSICTSCILYNQPFRIFLLYGCCSNIFVWLCFSCKLSNSLVRLQTSGHISHNSVGVSQLLFNHLL
jgi:hypothetical protein